MRWHDSLDIGSVRLTERFLHSDPPTEAELDDAAAAVRMLLSERVPDEIRNDIGSAIGVAGTLTSIAGLALGLDEYDRDQVHGFELSAEALDDSCSDWRRCRWRSDASCVHSIRTAHR